MCNRPLASRQGEAETLEKKCIIVYSKAFATISECTIRSNADGFALDKPPR